MGNRQFRRQRQRAQKKDALTPSRTKKVFLWVRANKTKAFGIGLAGVLAIAGARYHKDAPYWIGMKKPYQIGLMFSSHQNEKDIVSVAKALEEARMKGKPYHIMLVEASGLDKKDVAKSIKAWNERAKVMRMDYQNLAKQGITGEEATKRLRTHYGKFMDGGYPLEVCLLLAKEGVRIAPAESYDKATIEKIRALDKEIDKKQLDLQAAANSNAPLSQLQAFFRGTTAIYQQLAEIRENPTMLNMREIIAKAKQYFPELKNEREIRVFSQFGTYHRGKMAPEAFNGRNMKGYEVLPQQRYSIIEYAARNRNRNAGYGEFESRLETMAYYLDEPIQAMFEGDPARNIPRDPALAKKIFESTVRTTQGEFNQLSERTHALPYKERVNFLLNYYAQKK